MHAAVLWLIFALVLAGAEALTGHLFLVMLGGGALAAALTSWLTDFPAWLNGRCSWSSRCCCWWWCARRCGAG